MIEPTERRDFDSIVTGLHHQDPRFVRRLERLPSGWRPSRVLWAGLLWTVPPLLVAFAGRAGVILALMVCGLGAYVLLWRHDRADRSLGRP